MKQVLIYGVLLLGIAIAPAVYFYYNCYQCNEPSCIPQQQPGIVTVQYSSPKVKDMVIGEEFGLMAVRIMDGHIFQVQLENGHWVEARLTTATKDEATPAVIEALKTATSPSVILRRRIGHYWVVDFNLTLDAKRTTLLEWLREKKLTL
jgi:hypothetical protein